MSDDKIDDDEKKWEFLHNEIAAGMTTGPDDFAEFDALEIIEEAKRQKRLRWINEIEHSNSPNGA